MGAPHNATSRLQNKDVRFGRRLGIGAALPGRRVAKRNPEMVVQVLRNLAAKRRNNERPEQTGNIFKNGDLEDSGRQLSLVLTQFTGPFGRRG